MKEPTPVNSHQLPVNQCLKKFELVFIRGSNRWTKKAKNGVVWDKFGVVWAQFGVILDNFGVVWDYFGNIKTPKNRIFNTKNQENTKFPRLIPSKTPAPSLSRL
jgi:hypothetical protein